MHAFNGHVIENVSRSDSEDTFENEGVAKANKILLEHADSLHFCAFISYYLHPYLLPVIDRFFPNRLSYERFN